MTLVLAMLVVCAIARPPEARAFCGFYVGKADSNLFNHASQVVMVRHGDKSVLSLMNDYQGEPSDFALVVPVPEVLQKEQIHIGDREIFKKLDQYSSPRLVEYFDPNPCEVSGRCPSRWRRRVQVRMEKATDEARQAQRAGVTIEAQYTVGEYDIVILSAKQSDGLETWLQENGYKIPLGAHRALGTLHSPGYEILRREGESQEASGERAAAICDRSSSHSNHASSCCRFASE